LLGIKKDTPFVIMRFVSWDAYHDKGLIGFSDTNKLSAIREFSEYARVFISSENQLPGPLSEYEIHIPPEEMHNVLANACLFFGESATMASESAVLGTPAIFINEHWFGSTDHASEYDLMFCYKEDQKSQKSAIEKGIELLQTPELEQSFRNKRDKFMQDKIDATSFLVWFIENYPQSKDMALKDPEYQNHFK
jgi:predicted glycosyltransferase